MTTGAVAWHPRSMVAPITVRRHGEAGPLVAVLHGGPGAPGSAAGLARLLSAEHRVLEPLQRRSGVLPLSVAQHVADLAAVLDEPVHLVGWSWGAMLALSFTATHQHLVKSVVLVGCGTYDHASRDAYHEAMAQRFGEAGLAEVTALRDRLAHERSATARDALLARLGTLASAAQHHDALPDDADAHVQVDAQGYTETWGDALRLQAEGVEPARFGAITCPVLQVHGEQDPHPGPMIFAALRGHLPGLCYVSLGSCGHEPWRERRAIAPFNAVLCAWLRSVEQHPQQR